MQYAQEYEKEFKGKLGPGPAAYQSIEIEMDDLIQFKRVNSVERVSKNDLSLNRSKVFSMAKHRGISFAKAIRKLT